MDSDSGFGMKSDSSCSRMMAVDEYRWKTRDALSQLPNFEIIDCAPIK